MENMLRYSGISTLNISQLIEDRLGYVEYTSADGRQVSALAVMIGSKLLKDILVDSNTDWINSLTSGICQPKVSAVELQLLPDADILDSLIDTTASFNLLSLLHHLRTSAYRQASFKKWDWREQGIPWRARANEIIKRGFNGFATYPKVVNEKRHIGFILPLIEFGGVEKVALNMAQGMKAQNWIPHLFVIDSTNGAISKEWRDTFETVNFLSDRDFKSWGHAQTNYYGTEVPDWAINGQHGQALALLHWLDAIVNCHGGSISGIMGQLKRFGVKTVLSLHLSDLSLTNRPVGNTYLGLAYEHAYDFFAPCSYRLGNWCHALGIPAEKIITVPNAPSFPISTAVLEETQLERTTRDPLIPLRVMYIGRLDRQKGIDRLSTVINETLKQGLEIEWRVIGKSVIVEDAPPLSPEIISLIEPPIIAYEGLSDVYTWADVFVLLSSFEGLPLTILEAMRSGVVVLATDVGAVSEVLRNDVNGVLLNLNTAVPECVSALSNLAQDRSRLQRLSAQAFNEMRERDWVAATRPLSSALLELLEKDKPT
jgi:glycosyltransferase involved in cell wall biosynthesis